MTKRIHPNSRIFFSNPYVLRLTPEESMQMDADWRSLTRKAYKQIAGTWGHTALSTEYIQPYIAFSGMNAQQLAAPFTCNTYKKRGYFCFKDELDALQFRLMVDSAAVRVHIWPSNCKFTIYEYVDDES